MSEESTPSASSDNGFVPVPRMPVTKINSATKAATPSQPESAAKTLVEIIEHPQKQVKSAFSEDDMALVAHQAFEAGVKWCDMTLPIMQRHDDEEVERGWQEYREERAESALLVLALLKAQESLPEERSSDSEVVSQPELDREIATLEETMYPPKEDFEITHIDFVCDAKPDARHAATFVELEDSEGRSLGFPWVAVAGEGAYALRITKEAAGRLFDFTTRIAELEAAIRDFTLQFAYDRATIAVQSKRIAELEAAESYAHDMERAAKEAGTEREAARAEIERLGLLLRGTEAQRDAALARLAELEESLASTCKQRIVDSARAEIVRLADLEAEAASSTKPPEESRTTLKPKEKPLCKYCLGIGVVMSSVKEPQYCPHCNGDGIGATLPSPSISEPVKCPKCGGQGQINERRLNQEGRGEIDAVCLCPQCQGTTYMPVPKTTTLSTSKSVIDAQRQLVESRQALVDARGEAEFFKQRYWTSRTELAIELKNAFEEAWMLARGIKGISAASDPSYPELVAAWMTSRTHAVREAYEEQYPRIPEEKGQ